MLEKSFSQLIGEYSINVQNEYHKMHELFYSEVAYTQHNRLTYDKSFTLYDLIDYHFRSFPFRKTILSINEFDKTFGFNFRGTPYSDSLDKLILFCEYVYNLVSHTLIELGYKNAKSILNHIECLLDEIHYKKESDENGLFFFVPNNPEIISVCSVIEEPISVQILKYTHHSSKGNLEKKSQILSAMAKELEGIRDDSKYQYSKLFFNYANNCHVRHYNLKGNKKKIFVSNLTNDELEDLYDKIFKVGIIAFAEYLNHDTIQYLIENNDEINRKNNETI